MTLSTLADPSLVGSSIPAEIGMPIDEVLTPALVIDLDLFEQNVLHMREFVRNARIGFRPHAKTHKSIDIARYQIEQGGAYGICCQKVSEAEVMVLGGIRDVLVSNQVVDLRKIRRLVALSKTARMLVCVDSLENIGDLSSVAAEQGAVIECLVEIDCGSGRCGVEPGEPVLQMAEAINVSAGLKFSGIQAYQGAAQHVKSYGQRKRQIDHSVEMVKHTLSVLAARGIRCDIVSGAGTGSYSFEAASGVYTELQCGSYIFMDVHYQTIQDQYGKNVSEFENALHVLTSIMSNAKPGQAICDAGLKAHSVDSGLPRIVGHKNLEYIKATDEHGVITDPENILTLNKRLKLVPGHCDPTCNLHDWYVGIRRGKVEKLFPVSARGRLL